MPPRPNKFSSEIRVRIKNVDTLEQIKNIYSSRRFKSINEIINAALELGLPLLDQKATQYADAGEQADRLIQQLSPLVNSLIFNMKKITVLQTVQESMIGSLIQELEFYMKIKGVDIDPALLDEFRLYLPDRFEQDKQELIERLFDAASSANGEDDEQ